MRSLSSLGKSSETYGSLLTPSVLSKLPAETRKHMARDHRDTEWSIDDVMTGLLKEIQILDMSHQYTGKPSMHGNTPPPTASFSTYTDRVSQPRSSQQRRQVECTFCKGNHKANSCTMIVDPKERLAIVKRDNLCFNCLARHKASQCNSRFACRMCKRRHHTSRCQSFQVDTRTPPTRPQSHPTMPQSFSSQPTGPQPASSQPSSAPTHQTSGYTTMASAPLSTFHTSVCLLKTAIAEVSSYTTIAEGHILFDEGAQRSFITQQLADELHLQPKPIMRQFLYLHLVHKFLHPEPWQ